MKHESPVGTADYFKAYLIPFHTTTAQLCLVVLEDSLSSQVLMAPHI